MDHTEAARIEKMVIQLMQKSPTAAYLRVTSDNDLTRKLELTELKLALDLLAAARAIFAGMGRLRPPSENSVREGTRKYLRG